MTNARLALRQFLPLFPVVFAVSFLLNLFWEVMHSVLYDWNAAPLENSVYFYVPRILYSTLGDGIVIALIFGFLSALNGGTAWVRMPRFRDMLFLVFSGLFFAVLIEIRAHAFNWWSYNGYMPLVFGIGLTPLIQLSITSLVTLWALRHWRHE